MWQIKESEVDDSIALFSFLNNVDNFFTLQALAEEFKTFEESGNGEGPKYIFVPTTR